MYIDRYEAYLKELPFIIERCKRIGKSPFFGYTSNLDVLLKWDAERFNQLAAPYESLNAEQYHDGSVISSMEELIQKVGYHAINGYGGENDITSKDICQILEETFSVEYSLGGTCAQGAAAMAAVGVPIVAHVTDRSPEVMELLDSPNIQFVMNGRITDASHYVQEKDSVKHIIIQFRKGDLIKIGGKTYKIPLSNRLIVDLDEIHKTLPVDEDFLNYCEENAEKITSYNISGFNGIIDPLIFSEVADKLIDHYKRIKEKNPGALVYLEGAHYLNPDVKEDLFKRSREFVDLMGLNEEELVDLIVRMGSHVKIEQLSSVLEALELIRRTYHLPGLVMHTKDYSLYYGRSIDGVDFEKGLTLGNLMSGSRARTGRYATYEDCLESLAMPLSPVGLAFADELDRLHLEQSCFLVPSRYIDTPVCTIGLGDTFVAGMQIALIR